MHRSWHSLLQEQQTSFWICLSILDLIDEDPCECRAFVFEDILKGKFKFKMSTLGGSGSETFFYEQKVMDEILT